MIDQNEFMTRQEVAAMLRVTAHTLHNWEAQGRGPKGTRLGPKSIVYRRSTVLKFLADATAEA